MDIVVALGGLILFLPVLLLITVLIRLGSPGPVVYRQKRGGLKGSTFEIYKFRTMTVVEDGAAVNHATKGDRRLTAEGAFLRKSSFDELPQLINVLKGDMSIVGPRPHAVAHDEYYSELVPTYRARMSAKPGLTGLAQISGYRGEIRNIEAMAERVSHDLEYIEKWSLLLDLKLMFLTLIRLPFDPYAY
jgi:lipopolysaccharide/colanic/teichoic acid biosynthesis glycosyltransferase